MCCVSLAGFTPVVCQVKRIETARRTGMDGFLTKAFDPRPMEETIVRHEDKIVVLFVAG